MESLHSRPFQMFAAGGCIWDPASEPLASAAPDRLCKLCATCKPLLYPLIHPGLVRGILRALAGTEVAAASADRQWQTRKHAHPLRTVLDPVAGVER